MDPKLALISQKQQKQVDDDEAHIRSGKGMGSCEEEEEGDEDHLGPHWSSTLDCPAALTVNQGVRWE